MKTSFLLTALSFVLFSLSAQSFEGVLIYKLSLEADSANMARYENIIAYQEKLRGKDVIQYNDSIRIWLKGGDYQAQGFRVNDPTLIHRTEEHSIYSFRPDSDRVTIINTKKNYGSFDPITAPRLKPRIIHSDSTRAINGLVCQLLILEFEDFGHEEYWYNKDTLQVDWRLFRHHNYEYLNEVLKITGAIPMEIINIDGRLLSHKMRLQLVEARATLVDPEYFVIPELIQVEEWPRFMQRGTGIRIMQIKD